MPTLRALVLPPDYRYLTPVDAEVEGYTLELVDKHSVCVSAQPAREMEDLLRVPLTGLRLSELEDLCRWVMVARNGAASYRHLAALSLGIEIAEETYTPWFIQKPARTPQPQPPRPDPEEGRHLERVTPGDDGLVTVALEGKAMLSAPVWEASGGAKNWGAVIADKPSAPGGLERKWIPRSRNGGPGKYRVDGLTVGQPVEFAADYRAVHTRWYGVIAAIAETAISFLPCRSAAEAFQRAKEAGEEQNRHERVKGDGTTDDSRAAGTG